ncbi:4217_t:CDS:2 [Diversispora eburnea]|uniref:4217_t:CDS:1 n=1 Tax=Diversispora eburnea TaxID=1213867 RepID=A0A9N8V5B7_9GLOM|nr:4217_t:CDS:2 [Diversispora eburnea]
MTIKPISPGLKYKKILRNHLFSPGYPVPIPSLDLQQTSWTHKNSHDVQRIVGKGKGQPLPSKVELNPKDGSSESITKPNISNVEKATVSQDYDQQSTLEKPEPEKKKRGYKINRGTQPGTDDKVIENVENLDSPTINKEVEEERIFPAETETQKQGHQEGAKVNLAEDSLPGWTSKEMVYQIARENVLGDRITALKVKLVMRLDTLNSYLKKIKYTILYHIYPFNLPRDSQKIFITQYSSRNIHHASSIHLIHFIKYLF